MLSESYTNKYLTGEALSISRQRGVRWSSLGREYSLGKSLDQRVKNQRIFLFLLKEERGCVTILDENLLGAKLAKLSAVLAGKAR